MATATETRPEKGGILISVQVLPSSVDLNTWGGLLAAPRPARPPPAPPVPCVAASITLGSSYADWRSRAPSTSAGLRTLVQVRPPSVERYTPPPLRVASPSAETSTRRGSAGSTTMLVIFTVSSRPICCQVLPASVDFHMPLPRLP